MDDKDKTRSKLQRWIESILQWITAIFIVFACGWFISYIDDNKDENQSRSAPTARVVQQATTPISSNNVTGVISLSDFVLTSTPIDQAILIPAIQSTLSPEEISAGFDLILTEGTDEHKIMTGFTIVGLENATNITVTDGRSNGGERIAIINIVTPSPTDDVAKSLAGLGVSLMGLELDIDSAMLIMGPDNDTVLLMIGVNSSDLLAYYREETITFDELVGRLQITNYPSN